jgi:hypothetical protein
MDISGTSTPTLCRLLEIGFAAAHAEPLVVNPLENEHPRLTGLRSILLQFTTT